MLISTPFILLAALGGPLLAAAEPAEPVVTFILDKVMKANSRDGKPAEGRMLGYLDRVAGGNGRPDVTGWADAYKFRGKNLAKGYLTTGIVGGPRFGIFKTISLRSGPTPVTTGTGGGRDWEIGGIYLAGPQPTLVPTTFEVVRRARTGSPVLCPTPAPAAKARVGEDEVVVVIEEHKEVGPADGDEEVMVVIE
ncbi:hypothetical protein B0T25DRAFT_270783 [Lasiosphaeria hispida]|uniref:Uncharacterized protein n=1 Tax=Lasiosphaeria hispida TaxID=260671 RepID=A0AAJ0HAS7_9PEZI|nr:hypothetical protein B0T25DRAFT_270783 [Lasiosphaeria hispida]